MRLREILEATFKAEREAPEHAARLERLAARLKAGAPAESCFAVLIRRIQAGFATPRFAFAGLTAILLVTLGWMLLRQIELTGRMERHLCAVVPAGAPVIALLEPKKIPTDPGTNVAKNADVPDGSSPDAGSPPPERRGGPFRDVKPGHWAYEALKELVSKKVLEGTPEGMFANGKPITRYESAQMVARLIERGGVGDYETLQKLTLEFADELALLGVRVVALEDEMKILRSEMDSKLDGSRMGKIKVTAESRIRFESKDSSRPPVHASAEGTNLRFRLNMAAKIDDNVSGYFSFQDDELVAQGPADRPKENRHLFLGYADVKNFSLVPGTESYQPIFENPFLSAKDSPLSTFSIDVDTASYSNVRRFLEEGRFPPPDAVRIEELINYFPYDYPEPAGTHPIALTCEVGAAPWNPAHRLVRIALKSATPDLEALPPCALVFLVDVSGSMQEPGKLPLVKESLKMLLSHLRAKDRVALAVYAGGAGVALPPTPAPDIDRIVSAIDRLEAGGGTSGAQGIETAYRLAEEMRAPGVNLRVILATDGDFNLGPSSDADLIRLIEGKRDSGIFLSVLGFGTGNLKDSKMEQIADHGNGNYAYIDSLAEARKVLAREMGGTLFTVAKDVKIQVEFNPARVGSHRLLGYENRALAAEDFHDDRKDAGELGAGHAVTALYEIAATGEAAHAPVDGLKYQSRSVSGEGAGELLTVKIRYKAPDGDASRLFETPVPDPSGDGPRSADFRFASAVAAFGLLLRDSAHKGSATLELVRSIARDALGPDPDGHRAGFLRLVERAGRIGR